MKKLTKAVAIASMMTAGVMSAQTATAEVSATADLATSYLFRGVELGGQAPLISASLDYSHESGIYTGIWAAGGDTTNGAEYDLYVGFAKEFGDFGVDVGYVTYIYPSQAASDDAGDIAEAYLSLSYAGFGLSVTKPVDPATGSDFEYIAIEGGMGDVSALVGYQNNEAKDSNYTHLDVTYAFNDSLAFTASKVVQQDDMSTLDQSLNFVASYSLPIEIK
jgi:uncharacterized protein (TIGR02001 family)